MCMCMCMCICACAFMQIVFYRLYLLSEKCQYCLQNCIYSTISKIFYNFNNDNTKKQYIFKLTSLLFIFFNIDSCFLKSLNIFIHEINL
jgi:tRNA(Arg) A34 adenosine deaminase TadA